MLIAKDAGTPIQTLYDIDFLLGVQDESMMGALRFKLDHNGSFLGIDNQFPVPPLSSIRELQQAANAIETDVENKSIRKWLAILVAPGSSLGGARPKANVLDEHGDPWIAKFPSQNDTIDKGAWEYVLHKMALAAGVTMADSRILKVRGNYHTFLTKRFDRFKGERIHFASAMTMTGNNEETIKEHPASYLDLAEFIQTSGANIKADLKQLWRRIIFNIDMDNNELDFQLPKSVGQYFQLTNKEMTEVVEQVQKSVSSWRAIANKIGIPKYEQDMMEPAFRY